MEWRKCIGYACYEVSESGEVRRSAPGIRGGEVGKLMKPYVRADGYRMYILREGNKSYHRKAHQLVCEAYHGPKPNEGRWEVCHGDGTRTNDHWSNLRWGTSKDNKGDMNKHGTKVRGSSHPQSKLSDSQLAEIRTSSELQRVLASRFGICQAQVSRIRNGLRRLHV